MSNKKSDIELLAGLEGGGQISGKSGQKILNQLNNIVGHINKGHPIEFKVELNEQSVKSFKSELEELTKFAKKEASAIKSAFNGIQFPTVPSSPGGGSGNGGGGSGGGGGGGNAFTKAKNAINGYFKALADVDKRLGQDIYFNKHSQRWESLSKEFQYLADNLTEAELRFNTFASAAARASLSAEDQARLIEVETDAYNKYGITVEDAAEKVRLAAEKSSIKTAIAEEASLLKTASQAAKDYYKLLSNLDSGDYDITDDGSRYTSKSGNYAEFALQLTEARNALRLAEQAVGSMTASNQASFFETLIDAIERYNLAVEEKANKDKKAAEAAQAVADKEEKKKEEYFSSSRTIGDQVKKLDTLIHQNTENLEKWSSAKSGKSSSHYHAIEEEIEGLKELRERILSANRAEEDFDNITGRATATISYHSSAIREAGENTESLGERIKRLGEKFGVFFSAAEILQRVIRLTEKMVENVTEIDTAMTELRKVTNETSETYADFLENASSRAKNLGATVNDVVTSSADFARLGHSLEDASTLADVAIVYKNVGDGIENITAASESIISTMQAFKIEAKDAISIVDKFNIAGNNFAISSGGIGDALLNSAASLSAAGNSLDESIALIAAANETIQNPEKVGTALKTVSMYIRAAKTEAEEAGLATDGMANSVSELRKEILRLTGQKVDIMDGDKYKSTVQVLRELSDVWDELSDTTRTNITEMLGGGVRNANIISALMNSFDTVEEVLNKTANATGSALAENEKYLDSIAGKTAKFQASFEQFSTTAIDSDVIKGFLDIVTAILDIATGIVDKFGLLPSIIGSAGVAMSTLGVESFLTPFIGGGDGVQFKLLDQFGVKFTDITDKIGKYNSQMDELVTRGTRIKGKDGSTFFDSISGSIDGASTSMQEYLKQLGGAQASTGGYIKYLIKQEASTLAVKATQMALNAVYAVTATAIATLVVTSIYQLVTAQKRQVEQAREAISAYQEQVSSAEQYKNELASLYNTMMSDASSHEESLAARERILEIQDSLITSFGNEAASLNLIAMSADQASAAIDSLTKKQAQNNISEHASTIAASIEEMERSRNLSFNIDPILNASDDAANAVRDLVESYDGVGILETRDPLTGMVSSTLTIKANALEAEEILSSLSTDFRKLGNTVNSGSDADNALFGSLASGISKQFDVINKIKKDYQDIYENQIQWKIASESFTDSTGKAREYNDVMQDILTAQEKYTEELNKDYNGNFASLQQNAINAAASRFDELRKQLDDSLINGTMDSSVYNYMIKMLDEMQKAANKNAIMLEVQFAMDGKTDVDISDTAKMIAAAVSKLSGSGEKFKLSDFYAAESLIATNESGLFSDIEVSYLNISAAAKMCGMDTMELIQALISLGVVENDVASSGQEAAKAISSIYGLSTEFGEKFAKASSSVTKFSETLKKLNDGTLTIEEVVALIEEFPELAGYVDLSSDSFGDLEKGLREVGKQIPDKLIDELKKFKDTNDLTEEASRQIDNLIEGLKDLPDDSDTVKKLSDRFGILAENIARSKSNMTELDKELSEPDYDSLYQKDVDYFEAFKKEMDAGRYGSKNYQLYAGWFGLNDKSLEEQKAWVKQMGKIYSEDSKGLANFLKMVEKANDSGLLDKEAMMFDSETGQWLYDPARIQESADALDMTADRVTDLAEAINVLTPKKIEPITLSLGVEVDGEQTEAEVVVLKEDLAKLFDEDTLNLILNADGAIDDLEVFKELLEYVAKENPEAEVTLDGNITKVTKALEKIVHLIDWIKNNGNITVVTSAQSFQKPVSGGNLNKSEEVWEVNATGSKNHPGGPALLGDEYSPSGEPRPELVVSGDEAYIVGENGPVVRNLNKGDTVYTYDETRRILEGSHKDRSLPAFSTGTKRTPLSNRVDNKTKLEDAGFSVEKAEIVVGSLSDNSPTEQHGGAVPNIGTLAGSGTSKYDPENDKLRDEYEKRTSELEHAIFLLEKNGAKSGDIISVYNQLMQAAHEEAERLRALGVAENDEAIMDLQKQWWEYHDAIVDIEAEVQEAREEALEDAKSATEELIDYRIDMLKQDLENQKDTLNKELDAISDFYDEQRGLLNKAKEEKDYEKEQTEKRRAVSDIKAEIDMLKHDDSAWAQKRIAELQSDLANAEEDLASFEEDRALDLALENLDAQEEAQTAQIESEIEAIDAMLNDPEALYNKALADIQNNSKALYEEMVAYNNKYGSGNPEDIAEMWSEAFKFFNNYIETYGEPYKGITLTDVSGYASGTSHATPGLHEFDEAGTGSEAVFTAQDGTRYRMFRGGDKVLNPAGTDFLYKFAETHGGNLTNTIGDMINGLYMQLVNGLQQKTIIPEIRMGDIIVQGNADEKTVSQIRREQRSSVEFLLKELGKLKS